MTDYLPTLTLWQPWASLVMLGVKTIETRAWPAPAGLIGQRIGIHAAARPVRTLTTLGEWEAWPADAKNAPHPNHPDGRPARLYCNKPEAHGMGWLAAASWWPLPLGALLGTARLTACVPMVESIGRPGDGTEELPDALLLSGLNGHMWLSPEAADVEDQRPFGDFAPGRFAWLFEDAAPTTERCPWCDGVPFVCEHGPGCEVEDFHTSRPFDCPTCDGRGRCDPIPVPGRQKVWTWRPGVEG